MSLVIVGPGEQLFVLNPAIDELGRQWWECMFCPVEFPTFTVRGPTEAYEGAWFDAAPLHGPQPDKPVPEGGTLLLVLPFLLAMIYVQCVRWVG